MLENKSVCLVVSGGIAAYKAAELARLLVKEKAKVRVAMTKAATQFVTPLTFETLSQNPVADDLWRSDRPSEVEHIGFADWAEAVVVAPATANLIGKMAHGIADDFVTTFLLAVRAPILVCPSMNTNMFDHPAVRANLAELARRGCRIMQPGEGFLACGWEGRGRLPEPPNILEEVKCLVTKQDLAGLTFMVTSGPTREAWDDIRYLSNRSTGRMGLALALNARRRGAKVILVTGPTALPMPYGIETIPVESTLDMLEAVKKRMPEVDVLVKAAAPADFRPAARVKGKIKKTEVPHPIELTRNPDILAEVGQNKGSKILVGFAAESEDLIERSKEKLRKKNADLIVGNQIGPPDESFGAATNRVWIIDREDRVEEVPLAAKEDIAQRILDRTLDLVRARGSTLH